MGSRLLFVGDVHATADELDDCQALMDMVAKVALEHQATVLLAGDIYHTHGTIDAEVQRFWFEWLDSHTGDVIILEGNHDAPGTSGTRASALLAHRGQAEVVSKVPVAKCGILFAPYMSHENLAGWSAAHPECKTIICHATFDGAQYETGFYADDGIPLDLIAQGQVISGHIHTPAEFGKIWYPGSPRWRTKSDANVDRAIWLLDFDDDGALVKRRAFDTGAVCKRIFHFVDSEESPVVEWNPIPNTDYRVDVVGSAEWVAERTPRYLGLAKLRTFKTDTRSQTVVRESDGISVALAKWVDGFVPKCGTDTGVLKSMVNDRLTAG